MKRRKLKLSGGRCNCGKRKRIVNKKITLPEKLQKKNDKKN